MNSGMRFGLSGRGGGLESDGSTPITELARLADDLGFDCLWINEEHFGRDGHRETPRFNVHPSPVVLATALAMVTRRIRVGFSVLLLPLHHPIRVAEEIATLDVLSGGRVNFGISRGQNQRYQDGFGFTGDATAVFRESLSLILNVWQGQPITVGQESCTVEPRPLQTPHPPVFIGAYSDESIAWIAERGFTLMQSGIQSPSVLQRGLATYKAHGGNVGSVPVGRFLYVGESDAAARLEAWPFVVRQAVRLHQIGLHRRPNPVITEAELDPERFYHETAIVGGPDTVARRLAELRDEHGVGYVNLMSGFFGFVPEHLLRASLTRFAEQVMPRFAPDDSAHSSAAFAAGS